MLCTRTTLWTLAALGLTAAGCGPRVMPQGTGASGKVLTVAAAGSDRLDLINKLTTEQQRSFDRMHEPFDKVFDKASAKPPKGYASLADFSKAWDEFKFADVTGDRRHIYQATIKTSEGDIDIKFDDAAPNHVRAFALLAKAGFFDNTKLRFVDNALVMGNSESDSPFALKMEPVNMGLRGGAFICLPGKNGKSPAEFRLLLKDREDLPNKASVLGGLANQHVPENLKMLGEVLKAAKAKPILVKEVKVHRITDGGKSPLFTPAGVNLPELDAQGKIKMPSPEEAEQKARPKARPAGS